jgi:hypothetical protein
MITKITIYGERCSGTNYLENLITSNFDAEITWQYGWKHFFGFNNLTNSDDTLFICIVRDPCDWINSLYRTPYHLSKKQCYSVNNFLYDEVISYIDESETIVIIQDRNMYNGENYKNIMELRSFKLKYLMEDLPLNVKNYILIQYESLVNDFVNTMTKIKDCGLQVKKNIVFPENFLIDAKNKNNLFKQNEKQYIIPIEKIIKHPNFSTFYERKVGYKY